MDIYNAIALSNQLCYIIQQRLIGKTQSGSTQTKPDKFPFLVSLYILFLQLRAIDRS